MVRETMQRVARLDVFFAARFSQHVDERLVQTVERDPLREKPVGGLKPFENGDQIVCHERLGGLLKYYSRLAA